MKRTIGALAMALLCWLTMASAANADRAPSAAERRGIAAAAAPHPARCLAIKVSTVDPRWALFWSRGLQSCPPANGWVLTRKVDGVWESVTSASGTENGPCSWIPDVPPRVGADLDICMLPIDCRTLRVDGVQLPVRVSAGRLSCATAREVVRRYFPRRGRGEPSFTVDGRRWHCAHSHGAELERGGVAHCASGWYRIMVRQPGG